MPPFDHSLSIVTLMKRSFVFNSILLGLVLAIGTVGCKHKPAPGVTMLNGSKNSKPTEPDVTDRTPAVPDKGRTVETPETGGVKPGKPLGDDLSNIILVEGMVPNPDKFKANTAYFDYDRHVVRPSERVKIEEVAAYLKGALDNKLMIDGHCDERGTEEYNRSLGERRALALREYLMKLGVGGDRVFTRTYGEDRPAVEGHDEAAWSKNRRGEFILLTPKPSAN